jgi:hypothetical protein
MSEIIPAAPLAPSANAPTPGGVNTAPSATPSGVEDTAPKEDPKFASRFAALTRKEQAIRQREQQFKEREAKYASFEATEKLIKDDPLAYMEKHGITFEQLTQIALNGGKKPAELRVQDLEDRLEREKKEREENETTSRQKAYETQRTNFLAEIGDELESDPEVYELVRMNPESKELIYNVIERHYENTKRLLSVKDAAQMVERHFEQEAESVVAKSKKLTSKFGAKAPDPVPAPGAPRAQNATLTNSQGSSVPTPSTSPIRTVDESKREAAKLLKWT